MLGLPTEVRTGAGALVPQHVGRSACCQNPVTQEPLLTEGCPRRHQRHRRTDLEVSPHLRMDGGRGPACERVRRWLQTLPLRSLCWYLVTQAWTAVEVAAEYTPDVRQAAPWHSPAPLTQEGQGAPATGVGLATAPCHRYCRALTPPDKSSPTYLSSAHKLNSVSWTGSWRDLSPCAMSPVWVCDGSVVVCILASLGECSFTGLLVDRTGREAAGSGDWGLLF